MVYYDSASNVCKFEETKRFSHGTQADVFLYNDVVLKVYYEEVLCRIDPRTFDILKRIKSRHFINLIKRYSKEKNSGVVDAYTATFIKDENNLGEYTVEQFLSEVHGLIKLVDFLSSNGILMSDVHKDSLIVSEHIKLIDPDKYILCKMPKNVLMGENRCQVLNALKNYLKEYIDYTSDERVYDLFSIDKKGKVEDEMKERIGSKKYIMDYLVK